VDACDFHALNTTGLNTPVGEVMPGNPSASTDFRVPSKRILNARFTAVHVVFERGKTLTTKPFPSAAGLTIAVQETPSCGPTSFLAASEARRC
jgi:hypothetical protein